MRTPEPPRTYVRIRTASGDTHVGYLDEKDLAAVRGALDAEQPTGTLSLTLYDSVDKHSKNAHIQIRARAIESLTL